MLRSSRWQIGTKVLVDRRRLEVLDHRLTSRGVEDLAVAPFVVAMENLEVLVLDAGLKGLEGRCLQRQALLEGASPFHFHAVGNA